MDDQDKSMRDTMEEVYDRMTEDEGGDEGGNIGASLDGSADESKLADVTATSSEDYRFEGASEAVSAEAESYDARYAEEPSHTPHYQEAADQRHAYQEAVDAPNPGTWSPYLQERGVTADHAFQVLLQTEYSLRHGSPEQKRNALLGIMAEYGIDLGHGIPSAQTHAPTPIRDPAVPYLEQQFGAILNQLAYHQRVDHASKTLKARAQIAEFKSQTKEGRLLHPHFNLVEHDMFALMSAGRARSLGEAYNMAVQANPRTRDLISEKRRSERRVAAHERAQRAKRQSKTNLITSKAPGGPKAPKTMRETMEEVYDRMTS